MATGEYILNWSNDLIKPTFIIQPRTLDNSTSLTLTGKGYNNWGEILQENLLHIMENFASSAPPVNMTRGQLWFDTNLDMIKVWSGTEWKQISGVDASATQPPLPLSGQLWYDTVNNILKYWDGTNWETLATVTQVTAISDALSTHITDSSVHISTTQNSLLDSLSSTGYLDGLTGNVQGQIDLKVNRSGDTMTGFLSLNADPTVAIHAATKAYVDKTIYQAFQILAGSDPGNVLYQKRYDIAATAGQTVFTLPFSFNATGALCVYINGVKQGSGALTENSNTQVTFSVPMVAGSIVEFEKTLFVPPYLNSPSVNGVSTITREEFVATAGQTIFNLANAYTPGTNTLLVWIDGVKQIVGEGYTETSTTSITLTTPLTGGNAVEVVRVTLVGSASIYREVLVASSTGQTAFVLTTPYHHTNDPTDLLNDGVCVFIQGIYQSVYEFTETNGGSFVLASGVTAGTKIEFYAFKLA